MGVRGGGQREWNNRRGNGQRGDGRCRAAGTAAWEQALVRLELESCSGCSGEKINTAWLGCGVKGCIKKQFFFLCVEEGLQMVVLLNREANNWICVLNFCGGKRKGSLKFEKKTECLRNL